jgi:hypothetical protein
MSLHLLPTDGDGLIAAGAARARGEERALLTAHRSGSIVRLRRGVYLDADRHAEQAALDRYRSSVLAAARQRREPIFAGETAAVLLGLPIIGVPEQIVLLSPGPSGRRRNGVVELARRGDEAIVEYDGRRMTAIADTVIDIARTSTLLRALVVADAALHTPRFGSRAPRCSAADLDEAYHSRLPFPRSRRVAAMLERASPDADTPLETLSRLRIEELGFPPPEVQFAVMRPDHALPAYLDFAWPEHGIWGEADGAMKYTGEAGDPSGARRVLDEKRREDEIRAVTGWRCVRWGWRDAWDGRLLRDILRRAGLPCR